MQNSLFLQQDTEVVDPRRRTSCDGQFRRICQKTTKVLDMIHGDGVNAIMCSNEIDKFCVNALKDAGIEPLQIINKSDLGRIAEITGVPTDIHLQRLSGYKTSCIGYDCEIINERMRGTDFISIKCPKKCKSSSSSSTL